MNIPHLPFQKQMNVSAHTTFALTPLGRVKAEEFNNDPRTRVLIALEENGPSNISDISKETQISKRKLERVLVVCRKLGFIRTLKEEE